MNDLPACIYCGSTDRILMDHFIPKSITKADRFLVPACARCNLSKRNHHPKIWFFNHVRDVKRWQVILAEIGLDEAGIDKWMAPESNPVHIVSKMSQLLTSKGLTADEVAAKTGIGRSTIKKLSLNRFARIDNHTVTVLCRFFGLKTISDLIDIEWEDGDVEGLGA